MAKVLHHKAFHYFLIGLVTAGVSGLIMFFLAPNPSYLEFNQFLIFIPGLIFGFGVGLYALRQGRKGDVVFAWVVQCSFIFIFVYFSIIPAIILLFLIFKLFSLAVPGAIGAILVFYSYKKNIAEYPKKFNKKNLIVYGLVGFCLSFFAVMYTYGAFASFDAQSSHPVAWFYLFFIWNPPMLALLGYIDNPKKEKSLGKKENNSESNKAEQSIKEFDIFGWKSIGFDEKIKNLFIGRIERKSWAVSFFITILIPLTIIFTFTDFVENKLEGNLVLKPLVENATDFLIVVCALIFILAAPVFVSTCIRRLHDIGHSGWWTTLLIVPWINIIMLIYMFEKGEIGRNKYGPAPKDVKLWDALLNRHLWEKIENNEGDDNQEK